MGAKPFNTGDPDLITVQSFAEKFRVDASIVRGWIKRGLIPYELVGPRQMKCVRKSQVLKPIPPANEEARRRHARAALVDRFVGQGMDTATAFAVADSMSVEDIDAMLLEGTNG